MGANATREAQAIVGRCSTVAYGPQQMKQMKDMRQPSPRDFYRSGLRERSGPMKNGVDGSCQTIEMSDFDRAAIVDAVVARLAASGQGLPAPESLSEGFPVEMAADAVTEGKGGYNALTLQDDDDPSRGLAKGKCSTKMMEWHDGWLHSVECGELDIYTCLGLSNCFTVTPDTHKIIAKVLGVCVLQLLIPCILLKVELDAGFSYKPAIPGLGFRIMGAALYLYSLYSMYNNALDECRSTLLSWAMDQNVQMGQWLPLMIGEVTNVFVSLILVLTLFVIFVDVEQPADLILNAVAVNFLGAVDGEFVDDDMKQDALRNFHNTFHEYGADGGDGQEGKDEEKGQSCINRLLNAMLTFIVVSGLILSAIFLFAPSPEHEHTAKIGGRGVPAAIVPGEPYPKLI